MTSLIDLQNGSDIRGVAITTEEYTANLTEDAVEKIGIGIVNWLVEQKGMAEKVACGALRIAVGHDSRLSAETIKNSLLAGLTNAGANVIDTGLSTTPAMFMATQFEEYNCDASIMITASHLPYYYNGIKVFTKEGGAEKRDIAFILGRTQKLHQVEKGIVTKQALIPTYAQDLVEKIRDGIDSTTDKPLTGFHIVVDAGNGSGGFFVEQVLQPLGADTTGSQFLNPDGNFPNHIPNPDNKAAMESIRTAVLAHQADLGVIFDTDVDRAAVVDKSGNILNRNNLIAVLASIVLEEYPNTAIVTNSPTSSHLKAFINSLGGTQVRYLCGYRNVINKAIELNEQGTSSQLAIETSGHAAFKENYFLDDGAYVIAKILMLLPKLRQSGGSLAKLIATLKQPAETQEIRFKINADDVKKYGEQVITDLAQFISAELDMEVDLDNHEGIRGNVTGKFGDGWFLLRMSLHEPLLVLQVENDKIGKNKLVFESFEKFFTQYSLLDQSKLKEYLSK